MEESYLQAGLYGLERGWSVLLAAGPGQADTRRFYPDSAFVPDTERWISPWLDLAGELPGVNQARIGLLGISHGGYIVLRAAAADHRFAAVVANSPIVDLRAYNQAFVGFDPEQVLREANDFGVEQLSGIPDAQVAPAMKDLTRALMARFGQKTFVGVFRFLHQFVVDPATVTSPTLGMVGAGEGPEPMRQYEAFLTQAGAPSPGTFSLGKRAGRATANSTTSPTPMRCCTTGSTKPFPPNWVSRASTPKRSASAAAWTAVRRRRRSVERITPGDIGQSADGVDGGVRVTQGGQR